MGRRLAVALALLAVAGCDRHVEPFDPNEQPAQPDLSRIFPAGAEEPAEAGPPMLPPVPGRGAPSLAAEAAASGAADGPPISGRIALAEALAARAPAGAVLFLIARRGPGPPVAVQRIAAPRFPLEFSIGPADKMVPTLPFAGELALSARLDADGNAMSRSPGDLQGEAAAAAAPGATGVEIVLDEVVGGQ
jgi:cytochrome c-type biogenesis protein CcmH